MSEGYASGLDDFLKSFMRHHAGLLTLVERLELMQLRQECDRLMRCKAQAAVTLRWRGHPNP